MSLQFELGQNSNFEFQTLGEILLYCELLPMAVIQFEYQILGEIQSPYTTESQHLILKFCNPWSKWNNLTVIAYIYTSYTHKAILACSNRPLAHTLVNSARRVWEQASCLFTFACMQYEPSGSIECWQSNVININMQALSTIR